MTDIGKYGPNSPDTSVEAAKSLTNLTDARAEVYKAILDLGEANMDEIAVHLDKFPWRQSISARLNELHHDYGIIEVCGKRPGISGRRQRVYRAVTGGQLAMNLGVDQ